MYQESNSSGLLFGLVMGLAAGVAVGLLLAPKPGSETREIVRQGINEGLERVRQMRDEEH